MVVVKGMAHITGGGITENLPRVLPDGCAAEIDRSTWVVPADLPSSYANGAMLPTDEMFKRFQHGNRSDGCLCRDQPQARVRSCWQTAGESDAVAIGAHCHGRSWTGSLPRRHVNRRVGVLVSGRGSNLQSIIDASSQRAASTPHVGVVALESGRHAAGLDARTQRRDRSVASSTRETFRSRDDLRSGAIADTPQSTDRVESVCLAGVHADRRGNRCSRRFPIGSSTSILRFFPRFRWTRRATPGARTRCSSVSGATQCHFVTSASSTAGRSSFRHRSPCCRVTRWTPSRREYWSRSTASIPKRFNVVLDGKVASSTAGDSSTTQL